MNPTGEAGHTIGNHTWSHQDLSRKTVAEAKAEIEKGLSAVSMSTASATILASSQRANSMTCSEIPYAMEQGIFLA